MERVELLSGRVWMGLHLRRRRQLFSNPDSSDPSAAVDDKLHERNAYFVSSILSSLPRLFDEMIFFLFLLAVFGIKGLQLFMGVYR